MRGGAPHRIHGSDGQENSLPLDRIRTRMHARSRGGPRTDLRDRGGDDFFPKLAPGSGGSVHENGSCPGHMVLHGRGGLLGVTGFDRVDDVRVPFDIHVSQRAIHPREHD
jgi:hypothetical protein